MASLCEEIECLLVQDEGGKGHLFGIRMCGMGLSLVCYNRLHTH